MRPLVYSHVHQASPAAWQAQEQLAAGSADWLQSADDRALRYLVISKERNRPLAGQVMRYSREKQSRAIVLYQDHRSLLVRILPPNAKLVEATKLAGTRPAPSAKNE
jgi:hypothetical protein